MGKELKVLEKQPQKPEMIINT